MNITCVIVDDEKLARDLLQEYLQQMPNIQVLGECSKGKDAVETIDKLKPDLVFLDLNMPVMNGLDCLRAIKTRLKVPIPVTIYTTSQNPADHYRCVELGADFLSKPHNFATLTNVLKQKLQIN